MRDDLTAKDEEGVTYRPVLEQFDDDLDQWGRPKRRVSPEPTEALPEGTDVEKFKKSPWARIVKLFDEEARD